MQYNVKFNTVLFNNDTDTLAASAEAAFGDARYNNTWYGVNDKQSINSNFKKYNAGGGLNSFNYDINWQHSFDENWSGYAYLRYSTLANRVKNSPIVDKDDYFTFTIGALYSF